MPSKSWASDRRDTVLIADALRFIECHLASSRVNSDLCLSSSYMRAPKILCGILSLNVSRINSKQVSILEGHLVDILVSCYDV